MGNSIQQNSSLLVKNWVKVDTSTYRNTITEQLIDEHILHYPSEELMQASHAQLVSRASITHPNVIKLIYFCQDSTKDCCKDKAYRHKVFIQHQNQQLGEYLASERRGRVEGSGADCFCCAIASAFAYLSEKYGFFRVSHAMILLVSQIKWHKHHDKKTVKVWINSKLQESRPQYQCRQEEMCSSLRQVYSSIANNGVCARIKSLSSAHSKLQQLLEEVYRLHDTTYQKLPEGKKRVLSTYSSSNPNIIKSNLAHESSQDTLVLIRSNQVLPNNTTRNGIEEKRDEIETTKKFIPPSITRKIIGGENLGRQQPVSPFYRPPNASKINFAYNDCLSTPKQSRNSQQQIVNTSSPCIIISQQQTLDPSKTSPFIIPKEPEKTSSKSIESKAPKLESLTVNVMVESQQSPKQAKEVNETPNLPPSEECLKQKLAEILESEEHLPSLPLLPEVSEPQQTQKNIVVERCAESINGSEQCPKEYLDDERGVQLLHFEFQGSAPEINIEEVPSAENRHYFAEPPNIPLSESIRDSSKSDQQDRNQDKDRLPSHYFTSFEKETAHEVNEDMEHAAPNFGSITSPPLLTHTSKHDNGSKKSLGEYPQHEEPYLSVSNSEYSRLDSNYSKYLKKFNQAMNPISPRSKFSTSRTPLENNPSHSSLANRPPQTHHMPGKYNSLNLEEGFPRKKSKSRGDMELSDGGRQREVQSGELESLYNQSLNSEEEKKARIIERIENTEKIIRENRKKLQKIELEKDLEREKEIIKKEMESLLKNNLMSDESNRIKEKVKYKKATFAELKAEASKILEDLNF